ncbi:Na/Pi symporter [Siminovitchia sp. 179-K 8D1 HS]|uniref:Na/Pi symporter n=1 Tax=Siminovitchia sp. 179-K 8D1 HS TaxID=3142385 RepID=UPI0039A24CF5
MLYIFLFFLFAGCFLLGMTWMRVGLFNLSGSTMEKWLRQVTATPLKGMAAGVAMTLVLQSSSAVTVIAVGLVSARILSFPQTIGIILGTNIGTTVTLEILSFEMTNLIIPFLGIGCVCQLFKSAKTRSVGFILLGIGIIFASMKGFGWLSGPLSDMETAQGILGKIQESMLWAFSGGMILTAIIQSSTVVTGIAMSFFENHVISLEAGILIMIGSNIGTCSTALLAGIGAGREARLTAYAHLWLNVMGGLLFIPFIDDLAGWSRFLTGDPKTQLAHASVIFNILCSLAVLPFADKFGKFIMMLHQR